MGIYRYLCAVFEKQDLLGYALKYKNYLALTPRQLRYKNK